MGVSYEQAVRSFCGKNQHTIQMLIVGPKVHLCDEYVDACIEVLDSSREWCDKEIVNLKRLRSHEQEQTPSKCGPNRRWRWCMMSTSTHERDSNPHECLLDYARFRRTTL